MPRWIPTLPLFVALCAARAAWAGARCEPIPSTVSIYDLGEKTYKSLEGGLYAGGANDRPASHESAGLAIARSIVPLNTAGRPDPNGHIVLVSIGFSNLTQEWSVGANGDPQSIALTFKAKADALRAKGLIHPRLLIVDCAQGGQSTDRWAATPINRKRRPWSTALDRLHQAGASRSQVQVACIKVAHPMPADCIADDGSTAGDAGLIAVNAAQAVRNLKVVFPNLKLGYVITRIYGGYALTDLNPEPFAYETGFGVKWLIQAQIDASGKYGSLNFDSSKGQVVAPWLAWGPYLWANGTTPNGLGVLWALEDFRADDRTHPAAGAVDKVADALLAFFLHDATTAPWFSTRMSGRSGCAVPARQQAPFRKVPMVRSTIITSSSKDMCLR